jgi:chromosome segregation ATPase
MTTSITTPKSNVPVGRVTIDGKTFDVDQHPEFVRFFYDLFRRTGGSAALTNIELADGAAALDSDAQMLRSDLAAVEALRAVDELRNEFASIRSACDELRSQLSDVEAQFAGTRAASDLRSRIEQLEDRLP